MLPVIQFDPATMSLWYDLDVIKGDGASPDLLDAVAAGIDGSLPYAVDAIKRIENAKERSRALQLVSAFWHEKRHFLDMAATNYGAFRFRQFLEVYQNLPVILKQAKDSGKLLCPLEIYDDPVRRRLMGTESAPESFLLLGRQLAHRRRMVERDREQRSSRFGPVELGGEAQFECLAYLSQMRFVGMFFGEGGLQSFDSAVFDIESYRQKYHTIMNVAGMVGLMPMKARSEKAIVVDTALLEAVIFASLQSDYLPSREKGATESSYPADRLAALGSYLDEKHPKLKLRNAGEISLDECWSIVDLACKKVFDRTVPEQIEDDIAHFEQQAENKIFGRVPDDLESVAKDYFALRRRILERVKVSPNEIFSTETFVFKTAATVQPNYVLCTSAGRLGVPPEGYDRLMGYEDPEGDFDKEPYLQWWWACANGQREQQSSASLIRLESPKAWYSCVDFYAPVAKLVMNGRRIRTMLGPELMFAEQRLQSLGIVVEIFPSFEFPDEFIPSDAFFFYRGEDELPCDFTSEKIARPNGKVISPWSMRRWRRLAERAIEQSGGHKVAYFSFVRDWSPWFVSDEVYSDLSPLMSDN